MLTRRRFLQAVAAVAAATGLPPRAVAAALEDGPAAALAAAAHTTLARRLGPGAELNALGYRAVGELAGEPHLVREELEAAVEGRAGRRRSLLCFVHLTDQHVVDVQSTTRVEFLDRYADGECDEVPFSSSHRPQEAASARIADAMLRQVRRVGASPVTGAPITAAICTGDNTDNQQHNELDLFIGLMDGERVTPQSGNPEDYEGVQSLGDPAYWHPDPGVADRYKDVFGFPGRQGWLNEALAAFDAVGAGMPWYSCYGNHDGLAQGNAPVNPGFESIGTGPLKVAGVPPGTNPCNAFDDFGYFPVAPMHPVTADPGRAYIRRRQWIERHLASPGAPHGHGFTNENVETARAYYTADVGPIRWVVLDTVNPGGLADGSIGQQQLDWLDATLAQAQQQRRLVMLFSHHGPRSLDNELQSPDPLDPQGGDSPRHQRDAVVDVILAYPCVIAWVNGHSHRNVIDLHRGEGDERPGRFWDVGTAAHIDWPAQARLVEVADNRDGTLSIFGTMIDHDDDPVASFARELSGNDPQKGFSRGIGQPEDRNVELLIAHPFPEQSDLPVTDAPQEVDAPAEPTPSPALPATGLPSGLTVGGALMIAGAIGLRRLHERATRGAP